MRKTLETFFVATSLAASPIAAFAQETQTAPHISAEHPLEGAETDTCLPDGRETHHDSPDSEGQSINGLRILTAVTVYSAAAAIDMHNGGDAVAETDALASATRHCLPSDFDAALLSLPSFHFRPSLEGTYRDLIAALRVMNQGDPV